MKKGFTLIELMFVVAIISILMLIAIPNFQTMRSRVQMDICKNNLNIIKLAKEKWSIENNKEPTDTPTATDLDPYIRDTTASLYCPLDTTKSFDTSYTINNVQTNPVCKKSTNHSI